MTLRDSCRRRLLPAAVFALAACASQPPPILRDEPIVGADSVEPSVDTTEPAVRTPADELMSLETRLLLVRTDAILVEWLRVEESRCVFYFDPDDRPKPAPDAKSLTQRETELDDEVDRLGRDIDAYRARIEDVQARAMFDRDIVGPFAKVKARIASVQR